MDAKSGYLQVLLTNCNWREFDMTRHQPNATRRVGGPVNLQPTILNPQFCRCPYVLDPRIPTLPSQVNPYEALYLGLSPQQLKNIAIGASLLAAGPSKYLPPLSPW